MDNDDYGVREISTFDVHHSEINYRAEGNANIVLALPLLCQVLRLAKSKRLSIVLYDSIHMYRVQRTHRHKHTMWEWRNE